MVEKNNNTVLRLINIAEEMTEEIAEEIARLTTIKA